MSLPLTVPVEEADGVSAKMRSFMFSVEVASAGFDVTEPSDSTMPQSFTALYALTAFSGSC